MIRRLVSALGAILGIALWPFRTLAGYVAALVDLVLAKSILTPPAYMRKRSSTESLKHDDRMNGLEAIKLFYNQQRFLEHPDTFFKRPPPIDPSVKPVGSFGREGAVVDLHWPSAFEPMWSREAVAESLRSHALAGEHSGLEGGVPERFAHIFGERAQIDKSGQLMDKYFSVRRNLRAHARWFRHTSGPRPCAVLLHGYMSGELPFERWMWPVRRLFDSGMDVVLSVLPFHGLRRDPKRGALPPAFPSNDPRFTIEGFRHLVFDHTALFDYLLDGRASELGLMGMSLGGYSAALLSTIESRLKFAVLFIPLASIEDFALKFGRMVGNGEQKREQFEALREAQWAISPMARKPLVPSGRVKVIGARYDRVTGLGHAEKLAEHFGTSVVTFDGGHLLQFGRGKALKTAWDVIGES